MSTIVWLTFTQLTASAMGGYLAGRLRTKWIEVHTDEVYFRDTAHGFLAWAVASLVTAGLLTSVIGSILGAFAVAATLVRMLLPLVAARVSEWRVLAAAMLSTAVLFAAYPFMTSAWTMGLCSLLLGVALGTVQPMIMSLLHQITPEARHGEALGLRLMAINASSVVMPILFGSAGAVIGIAAVFWLTGLAVGLGSRAAWLLKDSLEAPHR